MKKYKINEIFESWQGEGFHIGKKVIFIRLAGCNLDCWFCDTNHELYEEYTLEEIFKAIKIYKNYSIVITGGEPFKQDITELVWKLHLSGYEVAIETNGTYEIPEKVFKIAWITCSPKGNWIIKKCDELKIVNDNLKSLKAYENIIAEYRYLMPMEYNGKFNYEQTHKLLLKEGETTWRAGIQLHKILNLK